jgi:predicted site-specific integrase-resolvase
MGTRIIYRTKDAAARAGVAKDTILRWLREGKVQEPIRDRNSWRAFSEEDIQAIVEYANQETPGPDSKKCKSSVTKIES